MLRRLTISGLALLLFCGLGTGSAADVRFGVLAHRGEARAVEDWGALGDFLSAQLDEPVVIMPLPPHVSLYHLGNRRVDFLLTQPVQSAIADEVSDSIPLATVARPTGTQFAGVIAVRRDSGINTSQQLRGRRLMTMRAQVAAGGYIFQAYYLHQRGLQIPADFAAHEELKRMDNLVYALRDGQTDAVFLRAGFIESMAKDGLVSLGDFAIIDGRTTDGYPFPHTTPLYPEWFVMAKSGLDDSLAARVKAALLALTPEDEAARAARITGFVEPLSLQGMKEAMAGLGIPPFDSLEPRSRQTTEQPSPPPLD